MTSHVRPRKRSLLVQLLAGALLAAFLTAAPAGAAEAPVDGAKDAALTDPIPGKPITSGLGLEVEELAQLPKSEPLPGPVEDNRLIRHNRINYLTQFPDGSGRLAVPDQNGTLYSLAKDGSGQHPYLDLYKEFSSAFYASRGLGTGFGYVAFDPDFKHNGRFYTVHTEKPELTSAKPDFDQPSGNGFHGIVTEWTADDPRAATFSGTHRELLRIGFNGQVHGIQQIGFDPTAKPGDKDHGLLYIAVGDGGKGSTTGDPQNRAIPHGKLLRIDPRGDNSANGAYGIPPGNPFVGESGTLGEIYAIGMRDPHRFSWDPRTHRMYLAHIGEHAIESVYEVKAGDNYGWSEREGAFTFDKTTTDPCAKIRPLPADDAKNGYTYPVAAYDHDPPADWDCKSDVGRGISGGYVYRGHDLHGLQGKYLFGDIVDGRLLYTDAADMRRAKPGAEQRLARMYSLMVYDAKSGKRVSMRELAGDERVDLRFGQDADGELYLLSKANGKIWKVTGTRRFASCDTDGTTLTNVMGSENWAPVTPSKWRFTDGQAVMTEPGVARPGPRRPFEYAVLTAGPAFRNVRIDAEVRIDTPVDIDNRDVIVVFGHESDTKFGYAHLSQDNTIYPHNGIFTVDDADRLRVEDQWDGVTGAPPAISDEAWHKVTVVRCGETGETAAYMDGSRYPLMTAVSARPGDGRIGFGSFDNAGRLRGLKVSGTS
ncbi:PQQ-dependent sugar dehydrogenase [Streptomyces endophyticus]|uniref:PQQ-dependent sugar dehydrogenase n=1 Tax=Streptomyces endophyticus TaxID=714166 RepID=A0ABU6F177_9ACTN|nr:PQQ-dependent sugar dehydrogenase [Streptomyces endophyticus]MEB8337758.1 PQQ-dependent sugar dehydrogenase [Streptomyces endophyticus]